MAEASASTGVPLRTVHRWVKAADVRARKDGRTRLVALEDVQRQAAQRGQSAMPTVPSVPGTVPMRGAMAFASDGELASRVFERLAEGVSPERIVREERLAPAVVLLLADQWAKLRASRPGEPTLHDQIKALRRDLDLVSTSVRALREDELPLALGEKSAQLGEIDSKAALTFTAVWQRILQIEQQLARR